MDWGRSITRWILLLTLLILIDGGNSYTTTDGTLYYTTDGNSYIEGTATSSGVESTTEYSETASTTESSKTANTAEPSETASTTESSKTANTAGPSETASTTESSETPNTAEPSETASTTESSKTANTAEPSETASTTESSKTANTAEPSETASTTESSETPKTAEPSETASTTESSKTANTAEPSETASTAEPSETASTTESSKTPNTAEPSETASTTESSKTPNTAEPSETASTTESSKTPNTAEPSETASTTESSKTPNTAEPSETPNTAEPSETASTTESSKTASTTASSGSANTTASSGSANTTESSGSANTTASSGSTSTTESSKAENTTESSKAENTTESSERASTTESSETANTTASSGSANTTASSGSANTTESSGSANTTASSGSTSTTESSKAENTTESQALRSSEALFDHGREMGDWSFRGDDSLAYMGIPRGFPTDNTREYYLYISTNGYIIFGRYYNNYYPVTFPYNRDYKIVAPFWADSTTYNHLYYYYAFYYYRYYYYYYSYSEARVYYQFYINGQTQYGEDASDLFRKVNKLVSEKKNTDEFKARWILKVTWYKMLPHFREEENTFQCILATDYHRSFTLFLYGGGLMSWPQNSYSFTPSIGYQMGSDMYYNSQYSGKLDAMRIDQEKGNTGKNGLWVYRLDSNHGDETPAQQCLNWLETKATADSKKIQALDETLSACPCTVWQAFFDPRFRFAWMERDYWLGNYCFYIALSPPGLTGSRKCCYKLHRVWWNYSFGWYWRYFFTLNTDEVNGGGLVLNNPASFRQYRSFIESDKIPHLNCCVLSGLCADYRKYRWLNDCSDYVQVRRARFWGDPHITTLDGKGYTFNGFGEYILLNVWNATDNTLQLTIQGRTERVLNDAGEPTDATIFTAFAAKDFETGATMQAELNRNKSGQTVFCNSVDYTVRFNNLSTEFDVQPDDNMGCNRPANKTLTVTFLSGISLNVSVGVELLEVAVSVPGQLTSTVNTKGLLGVFNNDQSDDFTLPDDSTISINSTEKEIFNDFGQLWMVTESTSVFTYRSGDGASNHSHPEFTPKFLSDYPQDRIDIAEEICGSDNKECIFDYLSTNRTDIAASTNTTAQNDAVENAALSNSIPKVAVQRTVEAVVGKLITIEVTAEDADNETLKIYLVNNITGFNNITQTGNSAILIWKPDSLDPVTISLSASDPSGAEAPLNTTRVLLCNGCSGNGDCDFNNTGASLEATSSNNTLFTIVQCSCHTGWEGTECNQDLDGCADNPCSVGADCMDLTPAQQTAENGTAYNCSSCPQGTQEVVGKCSDVDECNATTPVCMHNCFNSEGSYSCSCMNGYTLQDIMMNAARGLTTVLMYVLTQKVDLIAPVNLAILARTEEQLVKKIRKTTLVAEPAFSVTMAAQKSTVNLHVSVRVVTNYKTTRNALTLTNVASSCVNNPVRTVRVDIPAPVGLDIY